MKKIFTLLLFVSFAFAQGQTVNLNLPSNGTQMQFKSVSSAITHQPGGANQTWNFGTVTGTTIITYEWVDVNSVAQQIRDSFPGSTHAINGYITGGTIVDMYKADGSKFIHLGQKGSGSSWSEYNRVEFKYPMSYPDTFATYGGTGVAKYDGYGTLIMNGTTYTGVSRTKVYASTTSDTFYTYFQSAPFQKILQYVVNSSTGATQNKFIYLPVNTASVQQATAMKVSAYPNPADENIMITFENAAERTIRLLSIDGRVVAEVKCNTVQYLLSLNGYATGLYKLVATDGTKVLETSVVKN